MKWYQVDVTLGGNDYGPPETWFGPASSPRVAVNRAMSRTFRTIQGRDRQLAEGDMLSIKIERIERQEKQ